MQRYVVFSVALVLTLSVAEISNAGWFFGRRSGCSGGNCGVVVSSCANGQCAAPAPAAQKVSQSSVPTPAPVAAATAPASQTQPVSVTRISSPQAMQPYYRTAQPVRRRGFFGRLFR